MNLKKIHALLIIMTLFSIPGCSRKKSMIKDAFHNHKTRYVIYINKKNFTLEVYNRKQEQVALYRIGYGTNRDRGPKLFEGDNRTPEGTYAVDDILSMDAGKETSSYKNLRAMNKIFFKAAAGHVRFGTKKVDLGDNVYGPRFFHLKYPNRDDIARYKKLKEDARLPLVKGKIPGIGSGIAIHGNNDEASIGHLCSSGCIRMYNNDIIELDHYVSIGTPVIISAD